jgi:tetratricopeptide (TPR) repeat protein
MPRPAPRIGIWFAVACALLLSAAVGISFRWARWRRERDLLVQGALAYSRADWSQAADLARRRLKTAPQDLEALRLLARSTARLGRDNQANSLFARLGSDAQEAEDLFLLGIGLDRAGRSADASRMWEKSLGLVPDRAETLDRLITHEMARNQLTEAALLAARLARKPGWELRGELASATLSAQLSDPASAAKVLRIALERPEAAHLDRSALSGYRKLFARVLLRTARPGEARTILRKVLEDGPDREASWLKSRADLQEGALADAAAALEGAGSFRAEHPLEAEPSPFLGEAACARCHRETFQALQASRHSSTLLRGESLVALPYSGGMIRDPDDPTVIHQFRREGQQACFQTTAGDEVFRAVVDYAFGSLDHYLSLVGHDESGRPRILRLSRFHTPRESGWVRTTGHSAGAGEGEDLLGKPLETEYGLFKCLFCHSTNPRAVLDRSGPESSDRGIGCERCHGPGAIHQKAVAANFPDLAIVSPAEATAEGRLRLCGECHSHHQEISLPRTDPYWIRFQGTTLPWSRCYTESQGKLDCMTCHDPHHDTDRTEKKYTARCLNCHSSGPPAAATQARAMPATGTDHPERRSTCPVSPATGCIDCHMPAFQSGPLHATFRDHFIRVHPERTK